jgi:cytochrome c-type biogenesis protein CcmE
MGVVTVFSFHNKKTKQRISAVIIVILVLAMVLPLVLSVAG